ncbi:type II toxin-antitoxin system RelE/ParE family toxin [Mesorhizobium sp. ASY16-5R]|uniref:type II toxin-antitoxin system RelE/ParE family toxin n=1 Tax=Mesorhizobium sp. ASY16-5R TaxID=3445772 RepID=UPI003FA17D42
MKVVISRRVRDFLVAEKAYLRRHSNSAAKRLTLRMREAATLLADFPMVGIERFLPIRDLRRLVVDDYVLDYKIRGTEVHILNMRHGRQKDPYLENERDFNFEGE